MTQWTLIRRSLRFHARAHLGVLLGAAVGSAVLIGALVVGDSVKESLRERALERLGNVYYALAPRDRLFREQLASDIETYRKSRVRSKQEGAEFVAALKLPAMMSRVDGSARANQVQLIGVDTRFSALVNGDRFNDLPSDGVIINETLAAQLGIRKNDAVVMRVSKPSAFALESPISPRSDSTFALRLRVRDVLPANSLGNFNLTSGQVAPDNAFVSLSMLQKKASVAGRANMILTTRQTVAAYRRISKFERILRSKYSLLTKKPTEFYAVPTGRFVPISGNWPFMVICGGHWQLDDAELKLGVLAGSSAVELKSSRVFLESPVVNAALASWTNLAPQKADAPQQLLTYLVNLLGSGTNTTPYSMVTAAGAPFTPADMRDDEIGVNQWLADDLQVKAGDAVELFYFDPESGAQLVERTNTFRIRSVVPMEMPWADRTLMPDIPGIEKAESTSDWDAGFPLVHKLRQKDEDYWKQYRGTPKAFVTLAAGQKMWGSRFGNLTAIRFPIPTNAMTALTPALSPVERENRSPASGKAGAGESSTASKLSRGSQQLSPLPGGEGQGEGNSVEFFRAALERRILSALKPEELGLRFEPVREQALKAAEQSQDFGQLFLGFSFFLIVAALLLMALLFQFGLEQRTAEVGTLLALGFPPRQVRRLLLLEGCALALIGGVIGALAGTIYAKAMLRGLTTVWRDAVGTSALHYHARPTTLLIGLLASTLVAALTIWLTLRKQRQRPARELLEEGAEEKFKVGRSRAGLIGAVATASAVVLVTWVIWKGETSAAEIFFSAGALLLVAGLGFCAAWFTRLARKTVSTSRLTIGGLGLRGCSRRRKRSLATVALLACGTFLIAAIGVFRLDANLDATKRSSGTGGFALSGESTLPVVQDLNSKSGREFFGLDSDKLAGVEFVPFRVRDGDDASCLNLNRAQKPRLLGVKPEMLAGRFTFANGEGWKGLINTRLQPGEQDARRPENRLSGFADSQSSNTGLKPGTNEIEIPAIGDANSIQWALGKKIGDTLDYTDERGQPFKVRILGAVANSILQGSLIIDEAEFIKRFPSESGYRMFLVDSPTNRTAEVSATLSRALQDVGLELQPAAQKLAAFNAVQNTYLSTFQILGGLGLLLGSAGLGVVVLRNVLERRGELALLLAVGFRARMLLWLVLSEHGALLWLGLGVGVIAAAVAVLPSLLSPGAEVPYFSLTITLVAVLVNGMIWTWLAARFALRGKLLNALRNE